MTTTLLSCQSLSFQIGYKQILKQISFSLPFHSCGLIKGDNGSGKTTLLKVISRYQRYPQKIQWNNKIAAERVRISYCGHEPGLYLSLTLQENLQYFNSILPQPMAEDRIRFFLEAFQLRTRLYDPINTFSQGMKQKSALIRTFLARPYLYLLDEPLIGLDKKSVSQLLDIISELKSESALLIVTHNPEAFTTMTEYTLHLDNGALRC